MHTLVPSAQTKTRMPALGCLLIFCIWLAHLRAIDTFPPFIDEMIHIHGSEQGFTISPLANADLGRQFTIWWMMIFQAHHSSPIWVGRAATLLAVLPGIVALMGIGRRMAGRWGILLAGLVYLFSSYHFFFGRMALADPIAGSAVLMAIYFAYRPAHRLRRSNAILTGIFLFLAVGAKISTMPYLGVPIAAALSLKPAGRPWRNQFGWMLVALITAVVLVGGYIAGMRLMKYDVLSNSASYALTNRGAISPLALFNPERILRNIEFTFNLLSGYLGLPAVILSVISVGALIVRRRFYLPLCLIGPLAIIWINQIQESRFLFVPAALLLACAAVALATILRNQHFTIRVAGLTMVFLWGLFQWLPFTITAGRDPLSLPLPTADFSQYVRSDASGFGLAEVRAELRPYNPTNVIGILSNCQALRYLALHDFPVECPQLRHSGENIDALAEFMSQNRQPGTYVVLETLPFVPDSAPGKMLTVVERPDDGPTFRIYDLSQEP